MVTNLRNSGHEMELSQLQETKSNISELENITQNQPV